MIYMLSAANGLCRFARAKTFQEAVRDVIEYSETMQCQATLLDHATLKVLGRTYKHPHDDWKRTFREGE